MRQSEFGDVLVVGVVAQLSRLPDYSAESEPVLASVSSSYLSFAQPFLRSAFLSSAFSISFILIRLLF